jgi:hypothetical protein
VTFRDEILRRLASGKTRDDEDTARRRRQLRERRTRLRDLYELGDLERGEYVAKREAIDAELDELAIGPSVDLDGARAVLEDFCRLWASEQSAEPRRAGNCSRSSSIACGSMGRGSLP